MAVTGADKLQPQLLRQSSAFKKGSIGPGLVWAGRLQHRFWDTNTDGALGHKAGTAQTRRGYDCYRKPRA